MNSDDSLLDIHRRITEQIEPPELTEMGYDFDSFIKENQLIIQQDHQLRGDLEDYTNLLIYQALRGANTEYYRLALLHAYRIIDFNKETVAALSLNKGHPHIHINPLIVAFISPKFFSDSLILAILQVILMHPTRGATMAKSDPLSTYEASSVAVTEADHYMKNHAEGIPNIGYLRKKYDEDIPEGLTFEQYYNLIRTLVNEQREKAMERISQMAKDDEEQFSEDFQQAMNNVMEELNDQDIKPGDPINWRETNEKLDDKDNVGAIEDYIKDMIENSLNSIKSSDTSQWNKSDQTDLDNGSNISSGIHTDASEKSRSTNFSDNFEQELQMLYAPPIIPWQNVLRNKVGSVKMGKKKTMLRRNRRMPNRMDLQGLTKDKTVRLAVAIDTSGSMSNTEIEYCWNEIFDIMKNVRHEITVYECDTVIRREYTVRRREDFDSKVAGRGGTIFSPVFKRISELRQHEVPDILVYMTDGYGEYELEVPPPRGMDVIWVLTGRTTELSIKDVGIVKQLRVRERLSDRWA